MRLRDQFGTLTYMIFFLIDDPGKLIGHSKTYRKEEGFYTCEAEDMSELNECTRLIAEDWRESGKDRVTLPVPRRDAGKNREIRIFSRGINFKKNKQNLKKF